LKPAAIRKFDWLYLGSIAVGVLGFALTYGTLADSVSAELTASGMEGAAGGFLIGSMLVGVAINVALWFLISVLRIGFVKWILLLFVAWGLLSFGISIASGQAPALNLVIGAISSIMVVASVYYLFQPEATAWLAQKRGDDGATGE